jgi:hypothetical protein
MLGGPLHEMGVEYTGAIAVLLKRISSRMWDYSVSGVAVDRARQAVHDRRTLNWATGRQNKKWYLQRAVLAGYEYKYKHRYNNILVTQVKPATSC